MRRSVRFLSATAAAVMVMSSLSFCAFAADDPTPEGGGSLSEARTQRGEAEYFGSKVDEETLYNDDALKELGFNDDDIEYLKNGGDVTYGIKYDYLNAVAYEDSTGDSRAKLDKYLEAKGGEVLDSFVTEFYAARKRGDGDIEALEGITNVKGMFGITPDDYGSAENMLKNGSLIMLYLGGEEALEVSSAPIPDPRNEGNIWFEYDFIDRGDYAFLYLKNPENSENNETGSTRDPGSGEPVTDGNPRTGAAAASAAALLLSGALMTAVGKKPER